MYAVDSPKSPLKIQSKDIVLHESYSLERFGIGLVFTEN